MELHEFLTARLDEETNLTANTRNVTGDTWIASHGGISADGRYFLSGATEAFLDRRVADHVVRNQPQQVLIGLTLQRKIAFRLSQVVRTLGTADPRSAEWHAANAEIDGLTFAAKALAVRYKDHPGYDHEWIPEA
jgi:hypothetical protein